MPEVADGEAFLLHHDGQLGSALYRFDGDLSSLSRLAEDPRVLWAEPDFMMTGRHDLTPNDPGFSDLWGIKNTGQFGGTPDMDMDGDTAWDITIGDTSIVVLILDTGAQQDHPDLNQIPGQDFTSENFGGGPGNLCDNHGTAVSGCVSGVINNSLGTVGISPGSRTASARIQIGPAEGQIYAELDETASSELEQAAALWQAEHSADAGGDRPVHAELVLARASLPWQQVTRAEPGDAIVFPGQPPHRDDCAAWLRIASYEIPARLRRTDTGREVELQGDPQQTVEPDPWEPNRETIAPGHPVQLRVTLGEVKLTTSAVAKLRQGSTISLDAPLGTTAELRCGSRTVARGRLLEVNDCLGVRLTECLV